MQQSMMPPGALSQTKCVLRAELAKPLIIITITGEEAERIVERHVAWRSPHYESTGDQDTVNVSRCGNNSHNEQGAKK